jgi:diguanylate cyclase (GGDEF)-like protein/PAS domain S-box-containing protein
MRENMDHINTEIPDRKATTSKAEIIDFEKVLQLVIDNLPFDVWMKDMEGRYLAVNKSFVAYAGFPRDVIIGATDYDLYPPEEAKIYVASDRAVLTGEKQGYFESFVDGKWKEEYKDLAIDEEGNLVGTTGFSRNINQRKQMENALAESERSKAVLISNLPGVAYRCKNDKNWTMTFLSDGCYELTGYYPDELLNNNLVSYNELIHSDFRDDIYAHWESDIQANRKSDDEYVIVTKSGEEKWVWEQSVPVPDKDGILTESEGFILDITSNKQALSELDASEDRFRTIFEKAPIGIGIFNTNTGYIYQVNPKFSEILGRTTDELSKLDWKSYSHPAEIQENVDKLAQLKQKKISSFEMDKRYIRPDGSEVWVNMMIVPFKAETISDMHLCMIEDITEKKQKEEEIIYLSYHDSLTGLYNRTFFEEEKRRFEASRRLPMSVIMGDVNGLKLINDSFGHSAGDNLLREIGIILKETCRAEDVLARIGGDEFVILLAGTGEAGAERLCQRIYKACRSYEKRGDKQTFYLSISLGYATKNANDMGIDDLLREAEHMLYRKKNPERKKVRITILQSIKKQLAAKNFESAEQFKRLGKLTDQLGEKLHLPPEQMKQLQLLLETHDMGELSMDRSLLSKDISLDAQEQAEFQKHTETGYRVALAVPEMNDIASEILSHHEHWNGTGTPRGLKGEEIPILSRVICIIDAYHSLTKEQGASANIDTMLIAKRLKDGAGTIYDPVIMSEFLELIR